MDGEKDGDEDTTASEISDELPQVCSQSDTHLRRAKQAFGLTDSSRRNRISELLCWTDPSCGRGAKRDEMVPDSWYSLRVNIASAIDISDAGSLLWERRKPDLNVAQGNCRV